MGQPDSVPTYLIILFCGSIWGLAFQLSHVNEFFFVINQMDFSTFVMIKMFLAALITSMISWLILTSISQSYNNRITQLRTTISKGGFCDVGLFPLVIGSSLLGVGMSFAGSCPGTVFAQLGAGSSKAWLIIVGGLVGALLWSMIETVVPDWKRLMKSGEAQWLNQTINQSLNKDSKTVTITLIAVLIAVSFGLEWAVPYKQDAAKLFSNRVINQSIDQSVDWLSWPYTIAPWIAGVMLGAQQLIMFGLVGKTLGSSTSYAVLISHLLQFLPINQSNKQSINQSERVKICRDSSQLWRLVLTAGVIFGAWIGTRLSVYQSINQSKPEIYQYLSDPLINASSGLIGGLLMVFGARLAEGCTSGHGITGASLLVNRSWIATACIFGSAMLTQAIVN